jgi:hypothetical protein
MESSKAREIEEQLINSINRREELTKEKLQLASLIGFKDITEEIEQTDKYGFIIGSEK